MRVVVDAFGGDNAPLEIIKGASIASLENQVEITLTGNKLEIEKVIDENLSENSDVKDYFRQKLSIIVDKNAWSFFDEYGVAPIKSRSANTFA